MLTLISLLKSGLLWNRFGEQLAITCYADALVKGLSQGQKPIRRASCMHALRTLLPLWLALLGGIRPCIVRGQSSALIEGAPVSLHTSIQPGFCGESMTQKSVKAALRRVCLRERDANGSISARNAIIIGFVGGFVRHDDMNHPEVQFAEYLRQTYPAIVHAEVFANHDGKHALRRVLQLLDANGDGVLAPSEKEQASIIIYGHSWGASQAITLARELEGLDIPVSLTIQVDSVHKPGHEDGVIPSNVRSAVNFYQTKGVIHGRPHVWASDPQRTTIIGNFRMMYEDRRINCDNYPWIARHLNKPHHEIENDPLVWEQIASMIDSELLKSTAAVDASFTSSLGMR
jgi:hypothetical protein